MSDVVVAVAVVFVALGGVLVAVGPRRLVGRKWHVALP